MNNPRGGDGGGKVIHGCQSVTASPLVTVGLSNPVAEIFIEDQEVVDKILSHLVLNQKTQKPPSKPKSLEIQIDYSVSQLHDYEEVFPDHDVFPDYYIG